METLGVPFFHTKCSTSGVCLTPTAHLNSDSLYHERSVASCASRLPHGTAEPRGVFSTRSTSGSALRHFRVSRPGGGQEEGDSTETLVSRGQGGC